MKKYNVMMILVLLFAAGNILMFQNCDKKMKFSTGTDGSFGVGEDDGDGGGDYNPGEGDGVPNPNDPDDPDNPDPGGGDGGVVVNPPGCTVTYEDVSTPVKVLFLIDKTGSNKDNTFTATANDGTDVNKNWRTSILNNLKSGLSLSLFSFNLTLFRGNRDNLNDGYRYDGELTKTLIDGFSNNSTEINAAITAFKADPDQGKTPYQAALARAKAIIQADIASDSVSKYSVIMITDGHPDPNLSTKAGGDVYNGADANVSQSVSIAKGYVNEIVSINSSRVNVNTVYYYSAGQRSSTAVSILTGMAETGKGVFIEATSSNYSIDFKNVIRVPTNTCP